MTYNIHHGEFFYKRGESNLQQIADVINEYKPDFVALQEVDSLTNRSARFNQGVPQDLVRKLAELTSMHGFFGKAMDFEGGGYGEGILARFPVQSRVYPLPTPMNGEGRALLTVTHTLPNGQQIVFAGTHLCHEFGGNRLAQSIAVDSILRQLKLPVVVGGDFNFRPDSEPYRAISTHFKDAALMYGSPKPTVTYANPRARIDYIFLSGGHRWTVKRIQVIHNDASDHMPVLVTLSIGD